MVTLFDNGTDALYMEKGAGERRNIVLYGENQTYGVALPLFRCSDTYLKSIFGLNKICSRKTLQMSAEDTELICETVLEESIDDYKKHGVLFGDFRNEFQGYTTKMVFGAEYHLWKNVGENQYDDIILDRSEYIYTLSPIDFLTALILVEVDDEEMQNTLINQLYS